MYAQLLNLEAENLNINALVNYLIFIVNLLSFPYCMNKTLQSTVLFPKKM